MKTVFNFICALLISSGGAARGQGTTPLERLSALVDYVATDYPGAVKDGKVVAEAEFAEQQAMLEETERLARELAAPSGDARRGLDQALATLREHVAARRSEKEILRDAGAIQKRLSGEFGLLILPLSAPDFERAKSLYATACASCHGSTGHADTDRARELKPAPLDFFDATRMARIPPQVAFHALTFGVNGTAMASFESLPAADRWSLAFYVISLRHPVPRRSSLAEGQLRVPVPTSPSALAVLSDAALDDKLASAVPDRAMRSGLIDELRTRVPFSKSGEGTFARARKLLADVAVEAGNRTRARELAIAAYLEGIEPHEAALRSQEGALAARLERAFGELRHAIDANLGAEAVRREVSHLVQALDDAEERDSRASSVPFLAALAIALREGFELSLLLAALLAFVRKSGHPRYARYIHVGWFAAVPAGVVTWFAVGAALGGAARELSEGLLTLVAAAMLLFVSHFVLGKLESRKWLKFLERKTKAAADGSEQADAIPWPLVGVAFIAAYREAIEVVLFFRALVLRSPTGGGLVALGALSGVTLLCVLVWGMSRIGRRLNPRPLMLASGILLTAIAISLVGQGVHALEEGGYLSETPLPLHLHVPTLGLFAAWQTVGAQLLTLLLVVVPLARSRGDSSKEAR